MITCCVCNKRVKCLSVRKHNLSKSHLLHVSVRRKLLNVIPGSVTTPIVEPVDVVADAVSLPTVVPFGPSLSLSQQNLAMFNVQHQNLEVASESIPDVQYQQAADETSELWFNAVSDKSSSTNQYELHHLESNGVDSDMGESVGSSQNRYACMRLWYLFLMFCTVTFLWLILYSYEVLSQVDLQMDTLYGLLEDAHSVIDVTMNSLPSTNSTVSDEPVSPGE
jgi:hypothetical protein